jgi:hypothetical protein
MLIISFTKPYLDSPYYQKIKKNSQKRAFSGMLG